MKYGRDVKLGVTVVLLLSFVKEKAKAIPQKTNGGEGMERRYSYKREKGS
jgi:hypothetical protein